ncbi:MAG: hypothetical protein JW947_08890, partial [Sedimentisphaerales bacterium]|nr:hypothetical protein [Sedimentisphaerales bacterium]
MSRTYFLAITMGVLVLSSVSLGYSGGSGTLENPYKIAEANDLIALAATAADYNKCFILIADINLAGQTFITAIIAKDTSSDSGYQGTSFTGVFDGNGHKITNFSISGGSNDYLGLFGQIGQVDIYSRVSNLGLEDAAINGVSGSATIGALAGLNGGNIFNCYSAVPVSGESGVGGLVGSNSGNITNCYSTGAVSGASYIGGLAGQSIGIIINSYSIGTVSGTSNVGGLVGTGGSIVNSYFLLGAGPDNGFGEPLTDEQMKQQASFVGWDFLGETANGTCDYWLMPEDAYPVLSILNGFIPPQLPGMGTSEYPYIVTDANDLGTVWFRPAAYYVLAGDINLSGITWSMAVVPAFYGVFDGCDFSIDDLSINGYCSLGLFGTAYPDSQIENLVLENSSVSGTGRNVGALVGQLSYGNIENCSSAGSINGTDYCVGGLVGYLYYGNIENCSSNGSVIATSPYIGGLVGFSYHGSTNNCSSTATVSSTSRLVGGLVGYNVYGSISDCCSAGTVSSGHYGVGGLAGASEYGTVSNCRSVGNVISSNGGAIGGLVGEVGHGSITNSSSTGNVSLNSTSGSPRYIGGLVGENAYGSISDCYSTGAVNGISVDYIHALGGLVGDNTGTITNCYSTGSVSGSAGVGASYLGGLVGSNVYGGGITNCYS